MSEASDVRKNQIAYFEHVLGVKTVLRPHEQTAQVNEQTGHADEWRAQGDALATLVFWHVGSTLSDGLNELQDRMIKALKRDPAQILKISADTAIKSAPARGRLRELLVKNPERTIVGLGVESAQMILDLWRDFAEVPELKSLRPGVAIMITPRDNPAATLRFLPTHGLMHLENSPSLKKETWAHLQSLALG